MALQFAGLCTEEASTVVSLCQEISTDNPSVCDLPENLDKWQDYLMDWAGQYQKWNVEI